MPSSLGLLAWQAPAGPHGLALLLALLFALLLDRLFGEPPAWLHPVVFMGRLLELCGRWIAPRGAHARAWTGFAAGALAWLLLTLAYAWPIDLLRMSQIFALVSLLPISLYNGQPGRGNRWFFYIFYCAHLIILYLLKLWLL